MAEFKRIKIELIAVPARLREVEEEHALAIAQSMVEHGQINPVTVRSTPAANKGATPYTLVAGAHRIRAGVINEDDEIDVMVVDGDQAEAQLIEITENLFRNDLSVIDRAVFVQTYRDVWETKYGRVEAGRPANRANLALLIQDEATAGGFAQHVADRMGFSKRSIQYLNKIAQNLHPALRSALRGTAAADNQSLLLKLAKEGPKVQAGYVKALKSEPDIEKVLKIAAGPKVVMSDADKQTVIRAQLDAAWAKADIHTRRYFLIDAIAAMDISPSVMEPVFAAIRGAK